MFPGSYARSDELASEAKSVHQGITDQIAKLGGQCSDLDERWWEAHARNWRHGSPMRSQSERKTVWIRSTALKKESENKYDELKRELS